MDCFLERHKQGEIERLKSPKFIEEIELIIKNSPKKKKKVQKENPRPRSLANYTKHFLETITPILYNLFHKKEGHFPIHFM